MESWSEVLRGVLDAPGVRYACLADPATGTVVAAHGASGPGPVPDGPAPGPPGSGPAGGAVPGDAAAVLGWGSAEIGAGAPGRSLEDAVITTGEAYHLVRVLSRGDAALLAYLRVDRVRGNLALARRALLALPTNPSRPATTAAGAGTSTAAVVPAQRDGRTTGRPADPGPRAVVVPEQAPAPAAERSPSPVPLPRREPGPVDTGPEPGTPPASLAPAARPAGGSAGEVPGTSAGPPDRPGGRWADDLRTMARILAGLRRLDVPPRTES